MWCTLLGMTLAQYLKREGLTDAQFAERVGVERSTITRLRGGQRPSANTLIAIMEETGGEVTANDFFGAAA